MGRLASVLVSFLVACGAPRSDPEPPAASPEAEPMAGAAVPTGGTDCHVHLDQSGLGGIPQDGQRVIAALEGARLDRACVLSPGHRPAPGCETRACPEQRAWTQGQNDWTLSQAATSERLLPFCSVPIGVDWAAEEVARCGTAGARGLKLHSEGEGIALAETHGAESLGRIADAAAAAGMPVLIHLKQSDSQEVSAFFDIATEHGETTFVAAHGLAANATMLAEAPPNVWIEISGIVFAPVEAGAYFVGLWRDMDMNRVLLGSDWPLLHPSEHLVWLENYPLSAEELDLIVRGNAERLFGNGE